MRTVLILLVIAVLGGIFVMQKRTAPQPAAVAQSTTQKPTPRPVSEHDWAKHSLDRAAQVKQDVLRQRAANKDNY